MHKQYIYIKKNAIYNEQTKDIKIIRYFFNDLAFIVTGGELLKINNVLDINLHVSNKLESNIGLNERSIDLIETIGESFLVDDCCVVQFVKSTSNASS